MVHFIINIINVATCYSAITSIFISIRYTIINLYYPKGILIAAIKSDHSSPILPLFPHLLVATRDFRYNVDLKQVEYAA